jgi:RNA polymerase sigma factor (sigma-70 family)
MTSIHDIWSDVLRDDTDAWRQLVVRYSGVVHTVAARAGLSGPDIEDCAQHVWLALYRNRKAIRDPQSLPAWLMRTARRRAFHMLKGRVRSRDTEAEFELNEKSLLPDEELTLLEQQAMVQHALSLLDRRCQHLLQSLFTDPDTKTYRQIAEELSISANALGPLRTRCLNRLKKILSDLGYEVH